MKILLVQWIFLVSLWSSCMGNVVPRNVTTTIMETRMKAKLAFFKEKEEELEQESFEEKNMSSFQRKAKVPCKNGKAGGFPCKGLDLLSQTSIKDQGSKAKLANDIWGWTDPETGKEYALTGFMDGFGVTDVSAPINPKPLVFVASETGKNSYWRDIKTYKSYAYIVADGDVGNHGMQIFDLKVLRDLKVGKKPVKRKADFVYKEFKTAHNLFINEDTGFGYAVGSTDNCIGLHVFDLRSNPLKPSFVGCYDEDQYTHDVQCVVYNGPDKKYKGKEVCFCYNEDHVLILDVADKSTNKGKMNKFSILSTISYPRVQYTHQGWLNEDQSFILVGDEGSPGKNSKSRSMIINVADLEKPKYVKTFQTKDVSIDHNLYIKGQYAFATNYQTGLRIHDISKLGESGNTVKEVMYFDTWPKKETKTTWNGAWSSYVFFNSGSLLISSQEYGLIIVATGDGDEDDNETNNSCKEIKKRSACESTKKPSKCLWGKPEGEKTARCYAPCSKFGKRKCKKHSACLVDKKAKVCYEA